MAVVTGLTLLAVAAPAQAHDIRQYGPYECGSADAQPCGYGQVRSSLGYQHVIVDACDTVADGFGYFVRYRTFRGVEGEVKHTNGSASGCGIVGVKVFDPVVQFKMCSDRPIDYCTGWYNA